MNCYWKSIGYFGLWFSDWQLGRVKASFESPDSERHYDIMTHHFRSSSPGRKTLGCHTHLEMNNEKNLGWVGYIGDEILPSYIGIIS